MKLTEEDNETNVDHGGIVLGAVDGPQLTFEEHQILQGSDLNIHELLVEQQHESQVLLHQTNAIQAQKSKSEEIEGENSDDSDNDDVNQEGATLLLNEVHFVDSDSQDEEVQKAKTNYRKWKKKYKDLKALWKAQEEQLNEELNEEDNDVPADIGENRLLEPLNTIAIVEQNLEEDGDRDSVYHSSEEDISVRTEGTESESDSIHDDAERRVNHLPTYDPDQPFLDFCLKLGFTGPKQFKEALLRYAVKKQVDYKLTKNTKDKVSATCKGKAGDDGPSCTWRIFASWERNDNVFRVKAYRNNHICNPAYKNRRVTANVIAKFFEDRLEENPNIKAWVLKRLVKKHLKVDVYLSKCIRAKQNYYEHTIMKQKAEFGKVWSYVAELRQSNEANTVIVQSDRSESGDGIYFKRMYVCLAACKEGFLAGCRRFIGLDGCFLKGILKGELLTAIGSDANNQIYPIAWAAVEVENTESWTWFMNLLAEDLKMGLGNGWCIISDQQKGLMNAIHSVIPMVEQRMCCRHLYANWRKKHRGMDLKLRFWAACKATYFEHFRRLMYDMALNMSGSGYIDMIALNAKHWARSLYSTISKCENVDNNMCESFNATIIEARCKCIIGLMEDVRLYVARRMREKRNFGMKWTHAYGPRIQKRLNKSRALACEWNVVFKSDKGYEVEGTDEKKHVIKLDERTCTCRRWDVTGIPCAHAVCAIEYEGKDAGSYLSNWYSKENYLNTYSYQLEPIRGEEFWPIVNMPPMLPPEIRNLPGRKKKKRRLEEHETISGRKGSRVTTKESDRTGRKMTCKYCKKTGHNKRGCPEKAIYEAAEALKKQQQQQHGVEQQEQIVQDVGASQPTSQPTSHLPITDGLNLHTQVPTQPPRAMRQRRQKERTTGLGLYHNPVTGLTILDPGQGTEHLIAAPTSKGNRKATIQNGESSKGKSYEGGNNYAPEY